MQDTAYDNDADEVPDEDVVGAIDLRTEVRDQWACDRNSRPDMYGPPTEE